MYKFIFLACFILIYSHCSGQTSQKKDTTSIISFVDKIIIKANIDTQNNAFSLNDNSGSDFKLFGKLLIEDTVEVSSLKSLMVEGNRMNFSVAINE